MGVIIISLFIGIRWGVRGVALGYTLATVALAPVSLYLVTQVIKLSWREFLRQQLPALACTAIMGMVLHVCRNQLYLFTDMKIIVLICATGVGVVTYTIANWFINRKAILELRTLIRRAI
jgi:predicted exporter